MVDREKVVANVTEIVSDMQEEVDEWKDYSDSELSHGLTCDCDWWYKTLQTLKDALALLKEQEPVVRCKDCKFGKLCFDADGHRLIQCTNTKYPTANVETWPLELDWYCAGGERRDGET